MGDFFGRARFQLPHLMRVRDVDEFNHAVSGSDLELIQLESGRLDASLGHVSLGEFSMDQGTANVPVRARGGLDRRRYGLSFFHPDARGSWNGHPVDESQLLYFMPNRELDGYTAGNYGWVSMVIPTAWVESMAATTRRADLLQMPRDCRMFRPTAPDLTELWQAAAEIASAAGRDPEGSETAIVCTSNLRNALGAALTAADEPNGREVTRTLAHFDLARRAERHLREQIAEPVCIDDMCVALRVSRRHLEYSFADAFGTSPSRYLRLLRLYEVHRRLRSLHRATTVTREALAFGFNHLGLFSVQYKKTFGESPSQTLRGGDVEDAPEPPAA